MCKSSIKSLAIHTILVFKMLNDLDTDIDTALCTYL